MLEFNCDLGEVFCHLYFLSLQICHPMQIHVFHLQLGRLCGLN